jgi:hypothetical protein
MVHALKEIQRVLASAGILIDLRPFVDKSPVEVVSGGETHLAGVVNQLPEDIANDEAANKSIEKAAEQGWFILERREFFPFSYYWDSPDEMQAYVEEEWADFVTIPAEVWRNARSLWAASDGHGQLRVQLKMLIARLKAAAVRARQIS